MFNLKSFQTPVHTPSLPLTPAKAAVVETKKPRKNRSAYSLFAIDIKPKLKNTNGSKMGCVEMQTAISNLWNNLPEDEKKVYQERANEEKLHYMLKLKKFYENASAETIEEANKPKVKRPYSGYCYFVKEIRQIIDIPNTKFKMQEILKQASEKWRNLNAEERAVYQEKARVAKENFTYESTEESEPNDSIKMEESVVSDPSIKDPKNKKVDKKKESSLLKKRGGINFSKEIQEKMDLLDKEAATKKIKTEVAEKPAVVKMEVATAKKTEEILKISPKSKSMSIEESAKDIMSGLLGQKTGMFFPEISKASGLTSVDNLTMMNPFAASMGLDAMMMNQGVRNMSLMMNLEHMRRSFATQMLMSQIAQNVEMQEKTILAGQK